MREVDKIKEKGGLSLRRGCSWNELTKKIIALEMMIVMHADQIRALNTTNTLNKVEANDAGAKHQVKSS